MRNNVNETNKKKKNEINRQNVVWLVTLFISPGKRDHNKKEKKHFLMQEINAPC